MRKIILLLTLILTFGVLINAQTDTAAKTTTAQTTEEKPKKLQDVRDLFNAWNSDDDDGEPDNLQGAEAWSHNEMPEQPLESGDTVKLCTEPPVKTAARACPLSCMKVTNRRIG